jgi:hypothetical protein
MAFAYADRAARQSVSHELSTLTANGSYGCLSKDKPDNVVRLMYENFSSLSLFVEGPKKHVKIRQLNKIITDYSVDVIAGCETRTDWRVTNIPGISSLVGKSDIHDKCFKLICFF